MGRSVCRRGVRALPVVLALCVAWQFARAQNAPTTFNASLLAFPVDTDMFAHGTPVPAGTYRVDVMLNEHWQGKRSVRFEARVPDEAIAQPCFSRELLDFVGFDPDQIDTHVRARLAADASLCLPLHDIVPHAQSTFDTGTQSLKIAAPQMVLLRRARGYVDPSRWDAGVSAATLSYDYNAWRNRQAGSRHSSHYLGLRSGVNLGHWRLRLTGAATRSDDAGFSYRNNTFYVERALPAWESSVQLGDISTRNPVFDSLPLMGVHLATEDSMRPDSLRGFAPVIRGIAQSNAKVSVTQLGMQIFETTVPPGPFVIDDLYPSGSGGDLHVTITEADGAVHSFTVSNNSLPELLRAGATQYSLAAGRYRSRGLVRTPWVAVASVSHGVNNTVTAYGGALTGGDYRAVSVGLGLNLPVGALTADASVARTGTLARGVGLRLGYARYLHATGTNMMLTMLRHVTSGYHEPAQGLQIIDATRRGQNVAPRERTRSQFSVHLSQQLPAAWGTLSLSASAQDYWQRAGRDMQYQLSHGRSFGSVSVHLDVMRSRNAFDGRWENQYMLSFSLPLDRNRSAVHLNSSFTHTPNSQSLQSGVSAFLGERRQHSYSVYAAAERAPGQSAHMSGGASLRTSTAVARLGASVSQGAHGSSQMGVSASGGVVAFAGGLVFTPELGETIGIVAAPGAAGVRIAGYEQTVNGRGYAVVPWLQAYRENDVLLDPKGVSMDLSLAANNYKVAPTRGAVVLLPFVTHQAYAVLLTLRQPDGSVPPFAAGVFDARGKNVGYVAQGGQALVRVDVQQGELTVRWGAAADQQCRLAYDTGKQTDARQQPGDFRRVQAVCA